MILEPQRLLKPVHDAAGSERPTFKVLLLARSKSGAEEVATALRPLRSASVETVPALSVLPATLADASLPPFVLLVEVDPGSPQDLTLIRELRAMAAIERGAIVALIDRSSSLAPLQAIRAGADDVLLKPIDLDEAREIFARVTERSHPAQDAAGDLGKIVVFMHFSGGAGATTLAVNSAAALAQAEGKRKVCLLDLDIQFGNAANLVDLPSASPVQDFLEEPSRLDAQMLDSMMLRHPTGLHVLSAPRVLLPLNIYGESSVTAILDLARRHYEFIVVDLPASLASWTDCVLHLASVIYVVTPLAVPSAHRFVRFLDLLQQEGISGLPLKLVANRCQGSRRAHDITVAQFEKAVGMRVDYLVPNDYPLISQSHSQGKPAVLMKPRSHFSESLKAMLGAELGNEIFKPAGRKSLFR